MFDIDIGMYGILLLCLLLRPMSFSSDTNTTASQRSNDLDERRARDGDYIGCYPLDCLGVDYHAVLSNTTTPDTCTATCKENGFVLAALYNRTECACACKQGCLAKPLEDFNCGLPCRLNLKRFCGGFVGASFYVVETSKSKCSENNTGGTDGREEVQTPLTQIYIAAGIGSAVIIVLIIVFACLRKSDRREVYSPRNHFRRWRAHAPSRNNEERPPNDPHTTIHVPELPPRNMSGMHQPSDDESTSHTQTERDGEPAIAKDIRDNMPVAGSSFYHVLTEEDGAETRSRGLSMATENAYAYADCRAYIDSFPRSAAFVQRQAETPRYPEYNEQVEHEMVNNELYAISKK